MKAGVRCAWYALGLYLVTMLPVTVFAESIVVNVQGFDDGVRTTREQDYEEAVSSAKERAVEGRGSAILLPGFKIIDIGYLENKKYSVVLTGEVKTEESRREADVEGLLGTEWGMSVNDVRQKLEALNPDGELKMSRLGDEVLLTAIDILDREWFDCKVANQLTFYFKDSELYKAVYFERHPPIGETQTSVGCGALILLRYENEVDSRYKNYGKPVKDKEYHKIWSVGSTAIDIEFIRLAGKGSYVLYSYSLTYERR